MSYKLIYHGDCVGGGFTKGGLSQEELDRLEQERLEQERLDKLYRENMYEQKKAALWDVYNSYIRLWQQTGVSSSEIQSRRGYLENSRVHAQNYWYHYYITQNMDQCGFYRQQETTASWKGRHPYGSWIDLV